MTRPSRRGLLGGLAVLAAPVVPAIASTAHPSPDAELIRDCARFLELEAWLSSPDHPQRLFDYDDMDEAPERNRLEDVISDATPKTPEGAAAIAGVALLCADAMDNNPWEGTVRGVARNFLLALVGPEVAQEEARRRAEKNARIEATTTIALSRYVPPTARELFDRMEDEEEKEMFRGVVAELERIDRLQGGAA